jgi:Tol biopolymer transport system component
LDDTEMSALKPGTRLGPYEILGPLGAGGMGEVYRARDTRLDRVVAVKVLPAHLGEDEQARQRFEREARAASSLNHPNICTLHDFGHEAGVDYLVMEHLEGETLAARLERGALPLAEALEIATQIADALDRAHEQGLVHRDLKPGNVMLTRTGAKLLDFGLAKPVAGALGRSAQDLAASPTRTTPLTAAGSIVGTFQYMAPEQIEGQEADARSDLFAFGAVVYEMITGRRPFEGQTQASVIARVLETEPPSMRELQTVTPPALERLVLTCLAKDPESRWQSAKDLRRELQWIATQGSDDVGAGAAPAETAPVRSKAWWGPWIVVAALAVTSLVLGWLVVRQPAGERGAVYVSVDPAPGSSPVSMGVAAGPVRVSPDGTTIVFVARGEKTPGTLWVRRLGEPEAVQLAGTQNATRPFWSPDSRSIGFFADGKLKKIAATGGPAFTLADTPDPRGGSWNPDGVIIFSPNFVGPVYRVSANGGATSPVTEIDESRSEATHRYPEFLPDGRHFLYLSRQKGAGRGPEPLVLLGSLDSMERRVVVRGATNAVYASGHLLYVLESTLMAQPFDADRLEATGEAVPLIDGVRFDRRFSRGVFSASGNGVLAYQTGRGEECELTWFDREGTVLGKIGDPMLYSSPVISPDGSRVAFQLIDESRGVGDIWIHDVERDLRTRLTFADADDGDPLWTSDGERIVFRSAREESVGPYVRSVDGTGEAERLHDGHLSMLPTDLTSDGKFIIYETEHPVGNELWAVSLESRDSEPIALAASGDNVWGGRLSPDGRWLAYASDQSGRSEIYVMPYQGSGGRWQISSDGGEELRWSDDGKEIVYLAIDGTIMAAGVDGSGSSFTVHGVRPLFRPPLAATPGWRFDVSSDGQRILVTTAAGGEENQTLRLVLDWTALLEPRDPGE